MAAWSDASRACTAFVNGPKASLERANISTTKMINVQIINPVSGFMNVRTPDVFSCANSVAGDRTNSDSESSELRMDISSECMPAAIPGPPPNTLLELEENHHRDDDAEQCDAFDQRGQQNGLTADLRTGLRLPSDCFRRL